MYPTLVKVMEGELLFLKLMAFSDRVIYPRKYLMSRIDITTLNNMLSKELRTVVSSVADIFDALASPLLKESKEQLLPQGHRPNPRCPRDEGGLTKGSRK